METATLLAQQLDMTREWTEMLIADLSGDDWHFQPAKGMGHALWLCGHLASAQDTLVHTRCLNNPVLNASFKSHFPLGEPVKSTVDHDFPSVEEVLRQMREVHAKTTAAVRSMSEALLVEPAFAKDGTSLHPHYRDNCGAVSHCVRHEAFHAGQIASIRRMMGKAFLR